MSEMCCYVNVKFYCGWMDCRGFEDALLCLCTIFFSLVGLAVWCRRCVVIFAFSIYFRSPELVCVVTVDFPGVSPSVVLIYSSRLLN